MSKSERTAKHSEQPGTNPLSDSILNRAQEYAIPLDGDSDLIAALASVAQPDDLPAELDAVISTLFDHARAVRDEVNQKT